MKTKQMNKALLSLSLLFLCNFIFAQSVTIQGVVSSKSGDPVSFASVALISLPDSTIVTGNVSEEDGSYSIGPISAGSYFIETSFIGYQTTQTEQFEIKEDTENATVDIFMEEAGVVLDEAIVTAKRPIFEQKSDRLIVNVANSALAAGGTAVEILQKVPGVLMVQGNVTLGGTQSVQVWIDGKPSPYTDITVALQNMPSDLIDKVELIKQPGAQFDASGGPILNIVLKKNVNLGFKGTASLTVGGGREDQSEVGQGIDNFYRFNPTLNLNYRRGKINLTGYVTHNQGDYFDLIRVDRLIGDNLYSSDNYERTDYVFQQARAGIDYYMNESSTVGFSFRNWRRDGEGDGYNDTEVNDANSEILIDNFITENLSTSDRSGVYYSAYFKKEINGRSDHTLNADFDYNVFNSRNMNALAIYDSGDFENRSLSLQDVNQPVDIIVGKIDYALPIDSTFKIETGVKASFATVDNQLDFYRNDVISEEESNYFLYKENINAAYVNASKTIGKVDLSGGLRVEQTVVEGSSEGTQLLDRNYTQWFPSASALYHLNDNLGIQTAYSKRVNRPGFRQQNPLVYFIDSLTFTRGNPQLRPEINHTTQLNLTYDGQPVFGISYSRTDDVIIENAPEIEGSKAFTTAQNLAQNDRLEIQLNFPINIGDVISGYGGNQAIRNGYNADYLGSTYERSKWNWLAYWQIEASLPWGLKAECGGFYLTKFLEEFLVIDDLAGVNVGLSKKFADDKGKVSLSFSDIFYNQKTNALIEYDDIYVDFYNRDLSRFLRLNVSYTFGDSSLKSIQRRNASATESSRVSID